MCGGMDGVKSRGRWGGGGFRGTNKYRGGMGPEGVRGKGAHTSSCRWERRKTEAVPCQETSIVGCLGAVVDVGSFVNVSVK